MFRCEDEWYMQISNIHFLPSASGFVLNIVSINYDMFHEKHIEQMDYDAFDIPEMKIVGQFFCFVLFL